MGLDLDESRAQGDYTHEKTKVRAELEEIRWGEGRNQIFENELVESSSEAGLTLRDVKNEGRPVYMYENKYRVTKNTPILTGILQKNVPIER